MAELVNPTYLTPKMLHQMRAAFNQHAIPNLRLQNFLRPQAVADLQSPSLRRDESPGFHARFVGPAQAEFSLFAHPDFPAFLKEVAQTPLTPLEAHYEEYGAGDYSLLHDDADQPQRLLVKFDLTKKMHMEWGGYDLITHSDTDPVIGDREYGALTIARLEPESLACVRYVNHLAEKNRVRLWVGVYRGD